MIDDKTQTAELNQLQTARNLALRLGTILELDALTNEIANAAAEICAARTLILVTEHESESLSIAAVSSPTADANSSEKTKSSRDKIAYRSEEPFKPWLDGKPITFSDSSKDTSAGVKTLLGALGASKVYGMPLMMRGTTVLLGALVVAVEKAEQAAQIESVLDVVAMTLRNALQHSRTLKELNTKDQELALTRRIDRELNDTMKLSHMFEIALDWALRVTLANSASMAVYDQNRDELRYEIDLGYEVPKEHLALTRKNLGAGVAHRVARSGHTEVIPDVSIDRDYVQVSPGIRSHVSVPVMREDRVIAVISVESSKLNAFTDEHVDFIEKLATRAGVAIDNARLYGEAVREREKLSLILNSTSDVVIAIGHDDRVILLNPSAIAALRLYADTDYIGQTVWELFENTSLSGLFRRAKLHDQSMIEEIILPDGRTYHSNLNPHSQIGWIIVMHDITEFKRLDQMKTELVSTVSHDLKQPLMIMNGYVDLLTIHNTVNERGERYTKMLSRSIQNMRQLIDDLLDLAKIETGGVPMEIASVSIKQVLDECLETTRPLAEGKLMKVNLEIPSDLPNISGDANRLVQIFNNLVSNAIKYTPPEGVIKISAEQRDSTLRIAVQDNGIGISPQDQAHIFDRFFRVKSPENENIEGSGLGLAIVKRIVEAHHGHIGLESMIGQGSTFYVTLPIDRPE
jgi:signal transduction histidine kinase